MAARRDNVWTTNGPQGEDAWGILALAIDPQSPTTVYAGSSGIFKSTDGGGHWTVINAGLPPSTPA